MGQTGKKGGKGRNESRSRGKGMVCGGGGGEIKKPYVADFVISTTKHNLA